MDIMPGGEVFEHFQLAGRQRPHNVVSCGAGGVGGAEPFGEVADQASGDRRGQ